MIARGQYKTFGKVLGELTSVTQLLEPTTLVRTIKVSHQLTKDAAGNKQNTVLFCGYCHCEANPLPLS
jgi:hypothetical protein